MRKAIEIISLIVGFLFLLSGFAKSLDSAYFTSVISSYGFPRLQILSPAIILIEAGLGLALIFRIKPKASAMLGLAMVILFSGIYLYGLLFRGVSDCGCFGRISFLNTKPWLVLTRNALFLCMLCLLVFSKEALSKEKNTWGAIMIILPVMIIVSFITGYTYKYSKQNQRLKKADEKMGLISKHVTTSADSTYVVFVFSYTCPHCMNSIANLNEYELSDKIDKVIGLAVENPLEESSFAKNLNPAFLIKNCHSDLMRLSRNFPTTFYIKNNMVMLEMEGEIPCRFNFEKIIAKLGTALN